MKTILTISKPARSMILAVFLSVLCWSSALAQGQCVADFTFVVNGSSVSFTNASTGASMPIYHWSFGDGSTNWIKDPVHTFNYKGTYNVCLMMYDSLSSCVDSMCKAVVITTGCNPLFVTVSKTNPSGPTACDGAVNITDITGGIAPYIYTWSPNVSNSSSAGGLCEGTYNVMVTDAQGCTGSSSITLQDSSFQNCTAGFTFSVNGNAVSFTNTSTGENMPYYFWDFGDGTYDWIKNPAHTFNYKGVYNVCLTMYDSLGNCQNTFCDSVVITTGCNPFSITASTTNPSSPATCDGVISITGVTGGVGPYTYAWSSNISTSSSATDLCSGSYDITVTDVNGCTGATSIYLPDSSNTGGCSAAVNLFQDSTNSNSLMWYAYATVTGTAPFTYLWDFGDGTTSTQQYPSHTYAVAGHYAVCLTITTADSCTSSSCDTTYKIMQGGLIKNLLVVPHTTDIHENVLSIASVFPNPARDLIEVAFSEYTQGELIITDLAGREVYKEKINANSVKVNVSNLVRGCYNLSIVSGDRVSHNNVMIAR